MARFIFRHASHSLSLKPLPSTTLSLRHRSSHPTKTLQQLFEVDLSSSSSGDCDIALKLFDDLIQRVLVKKATPDWLPFVPGSSFWVPPRPSPSHYVDMVHKLSDDLSKDETLSLADLQGWPSNKYFIQDNEMAHDEDSMELSIPKEMEVTVKVKVLTNSKKVAHSEDEEG